MKKKLSKKPRLKKRYDEKVTPELLKNLGYNNTFELPRIKKVIINMGITEPEDPRARKKVIDNFVEQFEVISGQKPQITTARKSISTFKLRQGDPVGVMVTLRGPRMWEFLDKLISIVLPRVKDFKGISRTAFDQSGNYSLGLEEQIVFPEINYDDIHSVKGMQINICIDEQKQGDGFKMMEALGFPFEKEEE